MSYSNLSTFCSRKPVAVSDADIVASHQQMSTASPAVFGPHIWAYLHTSTIHLPENLNQAVATHAINTILAIPVMVPCDSCSMHSGNFISENKNRILSLKTGSEFFNFTVDFHNFVNKRLGKRTVSYEEARALWK